MEALKYPIGLLHIPENITERQRTLWMQTIEQLPKAFRQQAEVLSPEQLDTPYRPGGWTARQVIHHVAESHLNAYIRTKWILTEDHPTIKVYDEYGLQCRMAAYLCRPL